MGISKEKAVSLVCGDGLKELNKEGSGYGSERGDRSNLTVCVYNQ